MSKKTCDFGVNHILVQSVILDISTVVSPTKKQGEIHDIFALSNLLNEFTPDFLFKNQKSCFEKNAQS